MNKMDIYNRLPVFAQNLACYVEGRRIKRDRYSNDFWHYLKDYEKRSGWSYEKLLSYQNSKLQQMIKHCYETVPYYGELFDKLGLDYRTIKSKEDLRVLPSLTKDRVKKDPEKFISKVIPKSKLKIHPTGGTTGSGLAFYTTDEEEAEQWAVWWKFRKNLGIEFDMWCGNFGGKTVVPINHKKPPFWRINIPGKQVYFSGYHLNENTVKYYVEEIRRRNLQWLHGYPSNLATLASYMLSSGITLDIKFVTIGSENLYDFQSDIIYQAFNTVPYQHYGLTEGVANISQNTKGEFVVDEDFSVVEFIPNVETSSYSIIGTTLTNWAMPLIRYDTGDLATIDEEEPNKIQMGGRRVSGINGRTNEYVVLRDNSKVSSAALSLVFKDLIEISEVQIIQKSKDKIIIKVVKTETYSQYVEKRMTKALRERLGNDMKISYQYVDKISRTSSGKVRLVISEIS
ncbi:hypothetical protein NVV31_17160 [Cytobacillus firmus]|uniref:phenylacetate--CoA ligase family protein n=1 Tax=Cytobacillus firmus TaxID=1399 RepID=UPI0021C706AD|nr:hypothetical protein [Cytobacillus firmus]MCU1807118.1 hypothetical protein [Cytobacillus firmus]